LYRLRLEVDRVDLSGRVSLETLGATLIPACAGL